MFLSHNLSIFPGLSDESFPFSLYFPTDFWFKEFPVELFPTTQARKIFLDTCERNS